MYLNGNLRYQHLDRKQDSPLEEWQRFIVLAMSYKRGHFRCYLCGYPLISKLEMGIVYHQQAKTYHCEHRIPRKKGGSNNAYNLEASCGGRQDDCNNIKLDHITFDVRLAAWRLGENVGYDNFKPMFQLFLFDENERYTYLQKRGQEIEYKPDELIPYRHFTKGKPLCFPGLQHDCTFNTAVALRWEQQVKTHNFFAYLEKLQNLEIRNYAFKCYKMAWGVDATDFKLEIDNDRANEKSLYLSWQLS